MGEKSGSSDFRYQTGPAKVPWPAVGENVSAEDLVAVVRFLLPAAGADYDRQLEQVARELEKLAALSGRATKLSLAAAVTGLEEKVKAYLGAKHAVFLTNATAGFEIGHKFAGLRPGDEVICPAITFCSTINYPLLIGARVVLADVDPVTLNLDPEDTARKITPRTRVIMPVHLGGYPVDMDPVMKIARDRGIVVIEDCAHAFGASYRGRRVGTIGDFGSFSFHEVKNITSFGEGGVLVTDHDCGRDFPAARFVGFDIAHPIDHWLYDVVTIEGLNGARSVAGNHSATEIQAVGLLAQFERNEAIIAARREAAEYLTARLEGVPGVITPPPDAGGTRSAHHLYLLQVDPERLNGDIQDFKRKLASKGVTEIPHFAPLYRFSFLRQLGYDTATMAAGCPNAEEAFLRRFTHLPLYPGTRETLDYLAGAVIETAREMAR